MCFFTWPVAHSPGSRLSQEQVWGAQGQILVFASLTNIHTHPHHPDSDTWGGLTGQHSAKYSECVQWPHGLVRCWRSCRFWHCQWKSPSAPVQNRRQVSEINQQRAYWLHTVFRTLGHTHIYHLLQKGNSQKKKHKWSINKQNRYSLHH